MRVEISSIVRHIQWGAEHRPIMGCYGRLPGGSGVPSENWKSGRYWPGKDFVLDIRSVTQSCLTLCDPMDWAHQAYLFITSYRSLLRLMSIESVMSSILSSVVPFSSCLQSFPASGSFPMSRLLAWGGQSIGVSASAAVLPMNIQDWLPLGFRCLRIGPGRGMRMKVRVNRGQGPPWGCLDKGWDYLGTAQGHAGPQCREKGPECPGWGGHWTARGRDPGH